MYNFLFNANDLDGKVFQFFGGEPLIHKALILNFIDEYKQELLQKSSLVRISMITNGTLLTNDFVDDFFSNDFVNMSISLDTDVKSIDHRDVTQQDIDTIIRAIGRIPARFKDSHMVSVRCTISRETAPYLKNFIIKLHEQGLRGMVIHPLTMSAEAGNIQWTESEWNELQQTIEWAITSLPGLKIQFSEGVGSNNSSNCMVGSDMIAVDASGDFSGCYFFTNQKAALKHAILGNIIDNNIYLDRYVAFQHTYNQMFKEEEQCKGCNLKGFCYQCPAGNLSTGHKQMFRPDSMCQRIVSLFLTLQDDMMKKSFKEKYISILESATTPNAENMARKMATHLMYKRITGHHLLVGEVDDSLPSFPNHEIILGHFMFLLKNDVRLPNNMSANEYVRLIYGTALNIREFYIELLKLEGIPSISASQDHEPLTAERSAFYFTLVHMLLLNSKGDSLKKLKNLTQL
jgi:radical SAM protein with 4Fe4S-binding SPASM domain